MALLQFFKDLFESLFMSSSPEVQKKQRLRKIDADLRAVQPVIYRGGLIQPNFAEAVHELYIHTKPLDSLFSITINSPDIRRNGRFMEQLFVTGYSPEYQELLASLSYERRKAAVFAAGSETQREFESQRRALDRLLHELSKPEFMKIDVVMADMYQFADFCHFDFMQILLSFDHSFNGLVPGYKPAFQPVAPKNVERSLLDLYYLSGNLRISSSLANAVTALVQIQHGGHVDDRHQTDVTEHLKVISYVLKHIITRETLTKLIAVAKNDPVVSPQLAVYKGSVRQKFSAHIQEYFEVDERRIKLEIKDQTTSEDLKQLFGEHQLELIKGYDSSLNGELQMNSPVSFIWITPLQIVKSFMVMYMTVPIKTLLNDIVIEGFFNNGSYKTQFSTSVYACAEALDQIKQFEDSFGRGQPNDVEVIKGFIRDSHKNSDFTKKLVSLVDSINNQARELVTTISSTLFSLYSEVGDMLADAKKPNSELVSNLKVLMMSTRNRDNADLLEHQYPLWRIFFDIMKNYAIIGKTEIKDHNG